MSGDVLLLEQPSEFVDLDEDLQSPSFPQSCSHQLIGTREASSEYGIASGRRCRTGTRGLTEHSRL